MEFCEICHRCRWANSFRRQRGKDYAGETACFGEAVCDRIPLRIQTKMEPRREADGVFLGKLDLSDEVIVGTPEGIETTRSFRRMTEDRQWNPETLRTFVSVPWNPRGIITDSPGGIRKRCITKALVQTHEATDGCAACQGDAQVHVPRCRKRFEDIFDREKLPGQPREVVQQEEPGRAAEEILPADQRLQMEQEPQQEHAPIPEPSAIPPQPSSSSHEEPMQVNTTPRRARTPEEEDDTRTVRPRLEMCTLISELCERDVPEIDWEKLGVDNSSVYDIDTGLGLDEAQVKAGRETCSSVFLHRTIRWNESGFSYRQIPNTSMHLIATLSLDDVRLVATPFTRDTGKGQANTLSELSVTERTIYMSGSGLLQYIALDRMDVVLSER